jgi:DNA-binding LacI/PurR family transcriptional regulator
MSTRNTNPSRDRVRAYRERMRNQGLRPVQIWVPDVRSAEFKREAHRQSVLAATSERAHDDQDWVEPVSIATDELPDA